MTRTIRVTTDFTFDDMEVFTDASGIIADLEEEYLVHGAEAMFEFLLRTYNDLLDKGDTAELVIEITEQ